MKKQSLKVGSCVRHPHFGALYVNDKFRDSTGTVYCGINGRDGVSYQFNLCEVAVITRDEFDREQAAK